MKKTELKEKLEVTKAKIKANSKDAHFADALIDDLSSIIGQLNHEPTLIHLPLSEVEDSIDGEHFEASIMKDGTAVYHTRGGYTIIADYRVVGLNLAIRNFIKDLREVSNLSEDDRKIVELEASANAYVLNVPMIAFSDAKFTLEIATKTVEYLNNLYREAMDAPLQPDDTKANKEFEEAVLAGKALGDNIMSTKQ
jgi:hypothetical protein